MEIVRFEVRFDGQTPVPVEISGLPGVAESYFTPVTFQKFTAKKGMTSGQHRVEVRACSSTTCFEWSTPLVFRCLSLLWRHRSKGVRGTPLRAVLTTAHS